jgi:hypothetical protein
MDVGKSTVARDGAGHSRGAFVMHRVLNLVAMLSLLVLAEVSMMVVSAVRLPARSVVCSGSASPARLSPVCEMWPELVRGGSGHVSRLGGG